MGIGVVVESSSDEALGSGVGVGLGVAVGLGAPPAMGDGVGRRNVEAKVQLYC